MRPELSGLLDFLVECVLADLKADAAASLTPEAPGDETPELPERAA